MEELSEFSSLGRYSARGHYDVRFIKEVLKELEGGSSLHSVVVKYGLSKWTVRQWIKKHLCKGALPARCRRISIQEKRTIVRSITKGELSASQATVVYRVSLQSIYRWQKQFSGENAELSISNTAPLSKKQKGTAPTTASDEVRKMRQQLEEERLKVAALNTLIDVAEEQLKINIRKKPGARQS